MNGQDPYWVVLFESTSAALMAEKRLKKAAIPHKVIPVPRQISSDCGVCIRFAAGVRGDVESALTSGRIPFQEIRPL